MAYDDICQRCGEKRCHHSSWASPEKRAVTKDHSFQQSPEWCPGTNTFPSHPYGTTECDNCSEVSDDEVLTQYDIDCYIRGGPPREL